jgi:ribulose-5-phosphate 4-epimerase/fuculose-1-phosphate aldolase
MDETGARAVPLHMPRRSHDEGEKQSDKRASFQSVENVPTYLSIPEPTFATVADERLHCKQRLAAACRLFGHYGFDEGSAGHLVVRDPEFADQFWCNPFGVHFRQARVSDLIRVDASGRVLEGEHMVHRAIAVVYPAIFAGRPEVKAAMHAHTLHGRAWSSLARPLDPIVQDACAFFNDHAVDEAHNGLPWPSDEGRRIAATLGSKKAAILRNHGLLTVGRSVDEAAYWLLLMDRACQVQLMAEAAGKPVRMSDEDATLTYQQVGSSRFGWASFQPLYRWIVSAQPDLLE